MNRHIVIILMSLLCFINIDAFTFNDFDIDFDDIFSGINSGEFTEIIESYDRKSIVEKANSGDPKFQFIAYFLEYKENVHKNSKYPVNEFLLKSAESGFIDAQAFLGVIYLNGEGTFPKDTNLAYKWLLLASSGGHPLAQYFLATMYLYGNSVEKNLNKAYSLFEKSSTQEFTPSDYALALVLYKYSNNLKLERKESLEKALELLRQTKLKGVKKSNKYIKLITYDLQKINKKNTRDKFNKLISRIENNDPQDQFDLGIHYLLGAGTAYNPKFAIEYIVSSAEQGHFKSQELLAILYLSMGDPTLKDLINEKSNLLKKDNFKVISKFTRKSLSKYEHLLSKWPDIAIVSGSKIISFIKAESLISGRNKFIEKNIDQGINQLKELIKLKISNQNEREFVILAYSMLYEIYLEGAFVEKNLTLANLYKIEIANIKYFEDAPQWGKKFIAEYINTEGKYTRRSLGNKILKNTQIYADLGIPDAIAFLGMLYHSGILGWKYSNHSIALVNYSVAYGLGFEKESISRKISLLRSKLDQGNIQKCDEKIDALLKNYKQ